MQKELRFAKEKEGKKIKQSYIRFMVIDSGVGIPKERLKNIFNLFEHSDQMPLKDSAKKKECKI